ncbi:cell wall hydrolase [Devosia neptuniae]|jgi:spore germination cell wall hydrolase CwlJ-like protein|uniref:Cell wall hydrolase n=1 Tax=Devosia litorisediminis TaxID=2829817 RepID=A0A942E780_9HYPH|nr:cell wall hydrolase [Devosia neptuniae]MBS3849305.1 cell wall hydrolase [Devosia litorisediminis]MCZ4344694.1 cell wall hydrolase [Devosia neptuniae]|tara:strand:- start:7447 stop:8484 length:1038 start_codon:yes stop_codon:yes gene_type:complete
MVFSHRPVARLRAAKAVRRGRPIARFVAVAALGLLSYAALTGGAFGPVADLAETLPTEIKLASASLSYSGVDPVITGSVNNLFASASFTGPNRAEKGDRVRPAVDALAFSRSFAEVRTRLAALRAPADPTMGQTRFADIEPTGDVEIGPRMSIAAINPSTAAALDAIAGIAPTSDATPMPMLASEQLAYARETAPVTGGFATGQAIATSDKELWCLSTAIYFEARGESYRGQVAVAQVVLNRVKDRRYPNTICGVVFQNQTKRNACQFSFACDGIPESINDAKSWAQAEDISRRFTDGELYLTEVADATHYHATYVRPAWAPRMTKLTQIGLHVFYRFKAGWLFG